MDKVYDIVQSISGWLTKEEAQNTLNKLGSEALILLKSSSGKERCNRLAYHLVIEMVDIMNDIRDLPTKCEIGPVMANCIKKAWYSYWYAMISRYAQWQF